MKKNVAKKRSIKKNNIGGVIIKSKAVSHRPVCTGHNLDCFNTVLLSQRGRKAHSAAALCDRSACRAKDKRSPFLIYFPYFIFSPSSLGTKRGGGGGG